MNPLNWLTHYLYNKFSFFLVSLCFVSLLSHMVEASSPKKDHNQSGTIIINQQPLELWWLNGEHDRFNQYADQVRLSFTNGPQGSYQWEIAKGSDKVSFVPNSQWSDGSVLIQSTGASAGGSLQNKDVKIVLKRNGSPVAYFYTWVFTPYKMVWESDTDLPKPGGYLTQIKYMAYDQFNRQLLYPFAYNESWISPIVNDVPNNWTRQSPGSGWTPASECGGTNSEMCDDVGIWTDPEHTWVPTPVHSTDINSNDIIQHWNGHWAIGSETSGRGALMRSAHWAGNSYLTWRRYRGVGRHE